MLLLRWILICIYLFIKPNEWFVHFLHVFFVFFFILPLRRVFCVAFCLVLNFISNFLIFFFYNLHSFQILVLCFVLLTLPLQRFIFRCIWMFFLFFMFRVKFSRKYITFASQVLQRLTFSINSFSAFCYPYFWFSYFCFIFSVRSVCHLTRYSIGQAGVWIQNEKRTVSSTAFQIVDR